MNTTWVFVFGILPHNFPSIDSDVLMVVGGRGQPVGLAAVGRYPHRGEGGQPVPVAMPVGVRPLPALRMLLLLLYHDRPRRGGRRRPRVSFLLLFQLKAHSLNNPVEE